MTQSCQAVWGRGEITPRCCLVTTKVKILAIKLGAKNQLVCCKKAFFKQRFRKLLNNPHTFQHTFFSSNSAFRDPNSCWHFSRGEIFCSICSTWWRRVLFSLKWTKTTEHSAKKHRFCSSLNSVLYFPKQQLLCFPLQDSWKCSPATCLLYYCTCVSLRILETRWV